MPTVQRYPGQRVDLAPLPGVRLTAAETPLSEGAGVAEARAGRYGVIAGIGGEFARYGAGKYGELVDQARKQADDVALVNANNQLAQWENQRLYDPSTGALAVKGRDAFPLPEQLSDEYNQVADTVAQGLTTPAQKDAFNKLRLQRGQAIDLTIRRHVLGEMQSYQAGELQALVDNSTNAAIANAQDPTRVGIEMQRAVDAITTNAPALGLGPEEITKQVNATRSAIHVGVIDQLLAAEKTSAAQVYFDETRDQIAGPSIARIQAALEEGTLRGAAQKAADEIVAAGGSITDQREKARQIEDPKLRDLVMERVEHEASIAAAVARGQDENQLRNAYNVVDATHDVTKIPVADWAALPGSARNALRDYAAQLSKGLKIETDSGTYYGLMQIAANDPQAFAARNLLINRASLDDADFKHLAEMQVSIRNGDRAKLEVQLGNFRTNEQIVNDSLVQYGIDPTAKPGTAQGKAIAQLRRMLDQRVATQEALTGKKLQPGDAQAIVDGILSTNVKVPGSWWGLWPFGSSSLHDTTKPIVELTIADVPDKDRALITDALKKRGQAVSDTTILNLYIETQARLGRVGGGGR